VFDSVTTDRSAPVMAAEKALKKQQLAGHFERVKLPLDPRGRGDSEQAEKQRDGK
jgi:hypothetical protein